MTNIYRVLEIKKNGKWNTVKWYIPKENTFYTEETDVHKAKSSKTDNEVELVEVSDLPGHPMNLRDNFLSTHGFAEDGISDKGFPEDMSEDSKKELSGEYLHSKTYYTLSDLYALVQEWVNKREKKQAEIDEKKFLRKLRIVLGPQSNTEEGKETEFQEDIDDKEDMELLNEKVECLENEITYIHNILTVTGLDWAHIINDNDVRVIAALG